MLGQHSKTELGLKTVDQVYVFADQITKKKTYGVNLAFHVTGFEAAEAETAFVVPQKNDELVMNRSSSMPGSLSDID